MSLENKIIRMESEAVSRDLDRVARERDEAREKLSLFMRERDEARAEVKLLKNHYSMEVAASLRAELAAAKAEIEALKYPRSYLPPGEDRSEALTALAISQAEERGARWALEEAGHGLFNTTREEHARNICDAARKFEAEKLSERLR